jgi:hypothetical protein
MTFNFQPVPHAEAVAQIAKMPTVSRAVFDGLLPELRAAVFTVKGVALAKDRETIRDLIATEPGGENWNDVKRKVIAVLKANDFSDKAAERRAEFLLRHWTGVAYSAARYRQAIRMVDTHTHWQYLSMGDTKVRATHAALNQKIFPAPGSGLPGEEIWQVILPPWEWGCRCTWATVNGFELEEIRKADAALPAEQRRIVEGPILEQARKGILTTSVKLREFKNGVPVKERWTPVQPFLLKSSENWTRWNPDNIVPGLGDLKNVLKPESIDELMQWAGTVKVDGGATVADWIKGLPQESRLRRAKPAPAAAPKPEPKPEPVTEAPVPDILDDDTFERSLDRREQIRLMPLADLAAAHAADVGTLFEALLNEDDRDAALAAVRKIPGFRKFKTLEDAITHATLTAQTEKLLRAVQRSLRALPPKWQSALDRWRAKS